MALRSKYVYVSTITGKLPVLELALPFPVMAPITGSVFLVSPLLLIFHIVQYPYWQSAITGTGHDSIVPFPVLGSASFGMGVHWAPYQNCTLCALSHFRYWALPVLVRSFAGLHTGTGLYVHCLISSTGLCQFRYGHSLGPVPELDSVHIVPFPVSGSASSRRVICWAPYQNWTLCAFFHFQYWALPVPVLVFAEPCTGTGLYVCGPISHTALCQQFRFACVML